MVKTLYSILHRSLDLTKKTEKILFLGFSALMFILIGCSNKDNLQENKKSSAVEQTANLTAATPIQSLDPATAVDQTSITLLANVMEGLYRLDGSVAKF